MTDDSAPISYQLHIALDQAIAIKVGALGIVSLPAGDYVYTGSARRNLEARIARHLRKDKPLRWHIDYLLASPAAQVVHVERGSRAECLWNQATPGEIPVPGFGASDCRHGCGAHLKRLT